MSGAAMEQAKRLGNDRIAQSSQPSTLSIVERVDVGAEHVHDQHVGQPSHDRLGSGNRVVDLVGDQSDHVFDESSGAATRVPHRNQVGEHREDGMSPRLVELECSTD